MAAAGGLERAQDACSQYLTAVHQRNANLAARLEMCRTYSRVVVERFVAAVMEKRALDRLLGRTTETMKEMYSQLHQKDTELRRARQLYYASLRRQSAANRRARAAEQAVVCVVCLDRPCNTLLLPCRHARFCRVCAERLASPQRCPLCRTDVVELMRYFLN
jgi:hypothetical protein